MFEGLEYCILEMPFHHCFRSPVAGTTIKEVNIFFPVNPDKVDTELQSKTLKHHLW
jgi:hypothetical protein